MLTQKTIKAISIYLLFCLVAFAGCDIGEEVRDVVQDVTQDVVPYIVQEGVQEGLIPIQENISELDSTIADLGEQIANLNSTITSLTGERMRLEADVAELRYEIANLRISNELLENQNNILEIASQGYAEVIQSLGSEVRYQTERASRKEAELENIKNANLLLGMSIFLNLLIGILLSAKKLKLGEKLHLMKSRALKDKTPVDSSCKEDDL